MNNKKRAAMYMAMIGMALHSMKLSCKISDDDSFTYEFKDPISRVEGNVGLDTLLDNEELDTLSLSITGEDMFGDDNLSTDQLEEMFLKDDDVIMSFEDGTIEIYFSDLHLTNSSSIASIMLHLQGALLTVLRIRQYLYSYQEIE